MLQELEDSNQGVSNALDVNHVLDISHTLGVKIFLSLFKKCIFFYF